jgi:hypothetical protein
LLKKSRDGSGTTAKHDRKAICTGEKKLSFYIHKKLEFGVHKSMGLSSDQLGSLVMT